jgi:Secretion system C-terminal sorting domain
MKSIITLYIILTLSCLLASLNSSSQTYFNKDFKNDSSTFNNGAFVHPFVDTSGYLVVSSIPLTNSRFIQFMKIDVFGDTIWTKMYGTNSFVKIVAQGNYISIGDTNFVFVGTTWLDSISQSSDSSVAVLYKIDVQGNVLWEKQFGDSNKKNSAQDIQQTFDGGFIITGWTTGWGTTNLNSSFLLKVDSNGIEEWHQIYGGSAGTFREAYSIEVTQDNGYIMAGRFYQSAATKEDINVVKTDSLGNLIWDQTYGTPEQDNTFAYIKKYGMTDDYIVVGAIDITPSFPNDFQGYIARIDGANGNIVWVDSLGIQQTNYNEVFSSNPIILSNGDIVIVGTSSPDTNSAVLAQIVKYDGNGNLLWQRTFNKYGSNNWNFFWDVQQTYDGGFVLCGDLTNVAVPEQNLWVLKLDSNGCEIANCSVGIEDNEINEDGITVYPNPNNGLFTIELMDVENTTIEIYNIAGQLVLQKKSTRNLTKINLTKHSKGMYFVKVKTGNKTTTRKVVYQ